MPGDGSGFAAWFGAGRLGHRPPMAEPLPLLIPHPALTHGRTQYALAKDEVNYMGEAVAFVGDALRSLLGREPSASVALISRHVGQALLHWLAAAQVEGAHS